MKKKSPLKAITGNPYLIEAAFKEGQSRVPTYDPNVTAIQAGLAQTATQPIFKTLEKHRLEEREDKKERERQEQIDIKARKKVTSEIQKGHNRQVKASYEALMKDEGLHQTHVDVLTAKLKVSGKAIDENNTGDDEKAVIEVNNRGIISQGLAKMTNEFVNARAKIEGVSGQWAFNKSDGMDAKQKWLVRNWLVQKGEGNGYDNGDVTPRITDKHELVYDFKMPEKFIGGAGVLKSKEDIKKEDAAAITGGYYIPTKPREKVETYTADELLAMYTPEDSKVRGAFLTLSESIGTEAQKHHKNKLGEFNFQKKYNKVYNIIMKSEDKKGNRKDPKLIIADIGHSYLDGYPSEGYGVRKDRDGNVIEKKESPYTKGSFADKMFFNPILNADIYAKIGVLPEIDTGGGEDGKPDGVISEAEETAFFEMGMVNKTAVIDAIIKPNSPFYIGDADAAAFIANSMTEDNEVLYDDMKAALVERDRASGLLKGDKASGLLKGDFPADSNVGEDYDYGGGVTFPIRPKIDAGKYN
jgi:hypothetical protein